MVAETTPDGLCEKLADDDEFTVVDTRGPSLYTSGYISGSENLPVAAFGPEVLGRGQPTEVIASYHVDKNSKQVASVLDSNVDTGASNLRGGLDAWDGAVEDSTEGEDKVDLGPMSPF